VKHTPGPWEVSGSKQFVYSSRGTVADCAPKNAHLIAAAPEMLEALDDMVTEMYEQGLLDALDERSRAFKVLKQRLANAEKAIAKARGEK
jgi:hypothetical protein